MATRVRYLYRGSHVNPIELSSDHPDPTRRVRDGMEALQKAKGIDHTAQYVWHWVETLPDATPPPPPLPPEGAGTLTGGD